MGPSGSQRASGDGFVKILYLCSSGASDATRASIPFHLAVNGSVAIGDETSIVLAGDAAEVIVGNNAASINGLGLPPMAELLEKVKEHAVPVYV